ncbi:MAG TPA: ATP-binding protein [Solimonas sp.]
MGHPARDIAVTTGNLARRHGGPQALQCRNPNSVAFLLSYLQLSRISNVCSRKSVVAFWLLYGPSVAFYFVSHSGSVPRPGEITRAHNGILFLDELPEFDRRVLEVLREPLESGTITVSRAARQADFPARFQLIAAMNPCPCGHLGDDGGRCRCTPDQVARYRDRLSGPLLDRIDLQLFVPRIERQQLLQPQTTETSSADIRQRVTAARQRQLDRQGTVNARLTPQGLQQHCALDTPGRALIEQAMARLGLSARGVHRVLRVARTIADLDGETAVAPPQLAEALRYRELDRAAPG